MIRASRLQLSPVKDIAHREFLELGHCHCSSYKRAVYAEILGKEA